MPKPEWGTKRICLTCGQRFYDLGRTPIVCPNCGAVFDLEVLNRSRRARPAARAVAVVPDEEEQRPEAAAPDAEGDAEEAEEETVEEEVVEEAADEDDEALIEDAEELGDNDDMSDVIDGDGDEEQR